ncbi:odorant receptor 131-2-like [Leptodactylus fuscus]|uniref:odorant receptor 131-2-like n=1 Tax=Leptodactylus fuscus TaxID=238119 RepID=UPI003F4EAE6C
MDSNMTKVVSSGSLFMETMKTFLYVLLTVSFLFFLFVISLILHIFFTTPHFREHARYVLFIHMLINDTLYLVHAVFLLLVVMNQVYLPVPICYISSSLATTMFRVTPCNLAAMALERYVAVCFPLRHVTLCTPQKSYYSIVVIWFFGVTPNIIDFIVLYVMIDKNFFSLSVLCNRESITLIPAQALLRSVFIVITLVSSGLIITFTYIRVVCIAKNLSSRQGSASKAEKTFLLHAVQFLLCLFSLTSSFFENQFKSNFFYLPIVTFVIFMCLPRLLSPIIYGLRDQLLSKYITKLQFVKL